MRLTLRTLLAYLDDALPPSEARQIGQKLAETPAAGELADRIRRVTRRRGLSTPPAAEDGTPSDPNTVAEYLSDALPPDQLAAFEETCLSSDVHLAEVAACHQILTLVLSEQVRVPPTASRRMYQLVKGRESIPSRRPGATIPIGGAAGDAGGPAADDSDAGLLLGLPAYTSGEPSSRWLWRGAAVAGLLLVFGFAVWMALPPAVRPVTDNPSTAGEVAAANRPGPVPNPSGAAPKKNPVPKKEADPEPFPSFVEPLTVLPRPAGKPPVPDSPPATPDREPVTGATGPKPGSGLAVPAPRTDRAPVGRLEKVAGIAPVVVRPMPGGEPGWSRVLASAPAVVSADRLTALPGYRAPLRFDAGVVVELWGNLPDLFPAPLLDASVTPWQPAGGFDADLTVHNGRIYVTATRPDGAKVRLRFLTDAWDVTLPARGEVVFELANTLEPGVGPRTTVDLTVLAGKVELSGQGGQPVTLARGDDAHWAGAGRPPEVRPGAKLEPGARSEKFAYLAKVPVYSDATQARPIVQALEEFSAASTDGGRIRAIYAGALQDRPPSEQARAAVRVAVFTFAALADLAGLVDALNDPNRPIVRETAAEGLRFALAADPGFGDRFRKELVEKSGGGPAVADAVMNLLRGVPPGERARPETVDRLLAGLKSPTVAVRELSFLNLIGYIDVRDRANDELLKFDATAPDKIRATMIAAWVKRAEDLKRKAATPPAPAK